MCSSECPCVVSGHCLLCLDLFLLLCRMVMSAPNVLRAGRTENIFVECQDCSGDNDLIVEISVMQFPTKARDLASTSVSLNRTNKFQAFGKIKVD